jgi:hypothetical protein
LLAVAISLLVPFLNIPVYFETQQPIFTGDFSVTQFIIGDATAKDTNLADYSWINWANILVSLYILIGSLLLIRIVKSIVAIQRIINSHKIEKIGDIKWLNTSEPGTPFSFFKWLFWNNSLEPNSEKGKQIFRHELFHIRQRHTLDVLFMEIITILFWINPFFHLIKKELKAIHEFLADRYALRGEEKWSYAEMLLMQVLGTKHSIVNPFFHNQIKRRIAMITNPKKTSHQYLRQLLVLPILAAVFMLFAFSYRNAHKVESVDLIIDETPMVLDTVPTVRVVEGTRKLPKKQLTNEMINDFKDDNVYGVWIDGKRIKNKDLDNYKSSHFADYNVSKLHKGAVDYGKYYFQVNLTTAKYSGETIVETPIAATEKIILSLKGVNSPLGAKAPLIVIDGEVQESADIPLKGEEIASVTILKNKSAVDKYGEKAGNGVIEIITKSPLQLNEVTVVGKPTQVQGVQIQPEDAKDNKVKLQEVTVVGKPTSPKLELKEVVVEGKQVLTKAEIEPQFPGGDAAFRKFMKENLDNSIASKAPEGNYNVIIQMLIDESGKISNIKPISDLGYGLEQEAIRVMGKSPNWLPAIQNGKKVLFKKKIIITFNSEGSIP